MVARLPFDRGAFVRSSATPSSSTRKLIAMFLIARLNSSSSGESVLNTVTAGSGPGSIRSSGRRTSSRRSPFSCGFMANVMTGRSLRPLIPNRPPDGIAKTGGNMIRSRVTSSNSTTVVLITPSGAVSNFVEASVTGAELRGQVSGARRRQLVLRPGMFGAVRKHAVEGMERRLVHP